ncbi:MAG: hypothetical protein ACE5KM_17240 [Planctomycetaceae bacterium]
MLTTAALLAVVVVGRSADAQFPIEDSTIVSRDGIPISYPEAVGGIHGEPLNRFDVTSPWAHGYIQEMPAYGGFGAFQPYNYKHVFSQSQAAGGWGMPPTMPYAQQFWHRYRKRAIMMPEPGYTNVRNRPSVVPAAGRR